MFMAQWNCPQHYTRKLTMHGYINVVQWRDRTVQFRRLLIFKDTSDNTRQLHLRWSSCLTIKAWHRSYRYRMGVVHHIENILWTNRCWIHVTLPIRVRHGYGSGFWHTVAHRVPVPRYHGYARVNYHKGEPNFYIFKTSFFLFYQCFLSKFTVSHVTEPNMALSAARTPCSLTPTFIPFQKKR